MTIRVKNPTAPCLFNPPESTEVLYLIMPIKISDIRPASGGDDADYESSKPEGSE